MTTIGLILVGVVLAIGLAGVILPVLPGLLLCWAALLVWAALEGTGLAWMVFGISTGLVLVSQVIKYLIPGRWMRSAEIPWNTLALGAILAIVGFFVIPVIGLVIGFVLGVYISERLRLGGHSQAWPSTVHAMKALGLAVLIELGVGMLISAGWLAAVLFG